MTSLWVHLFSDAVNWRLVKVGMIIGWSLLAIAAITARARSRDR